MGVFYNPIMVTDGLIFYLDAGNTKSYTGSGTAWNDLIGRVNNGTITNSPTYSSSNGGFFTFVAASSQYVTCGNNTILDVGSNITVNCWFNADSVSSYQVLVAKVVSDFSLGWELANSSGTLRMTLRPSATQINLVQGAIAVSNWYMATMTFNGTTARLYLNGSQTGSTSSGGPVTLNSTQVLTVARRDPNTGVPSYFNGKIALVSMYNRALSDEEILRNFNATRGRFGI